jgi:hypothetical protein
MFLRVPPLDVPHVLLAERHGTVIVPISAKERTEQPPPLGRRVEAVGVVEDMARLVAHIHHDLAVVLEHVDDFFEPSQLRIGQIERNAEHRLLIRTAPLVGQVTNRAELLESAVLELFVQLPDVALDRRAFDTQAEFADLFSEDAANLRVQGLESDHAAIITAFRASERALRYLVEEPRRRQALCSGADGNLGGEHRCRVSRSESYMSPS